MKTPSVAERRAAEAEVRLLIGKFAEAHQQVIAALRRRLRKRLPSANEVVYEYKDFFVISFSPTEHGYDGVFAIRANAKGVQLYFSHGKELQDPEKLLKGSGKQMKYMEAENASVLAHPPVKRLIEEAIALNPKPFAEGGRGQIVLRSSSSKKRSRKGPPD